MTKQVEVQATPTKVFMPEAGQKVNGKGVDCHVQIVYSDSRYDEDLKASVYTIAVKSGDVYEVVAGSNFWRIIK